MTLQIPSLLMLVGAALLAIAIFTPKSPRDVAVPGHVPRAAAVDRWLAPLADEAPGQPFPERLGSDDVPPSWPERFDPRAAGCDAAARIELIGALAEVRADWSDAVLRAAFDEETDPIVRRALEDLTARRTSGDSTFGAA